VLIYGAGDAGEMIVREMIQAREPAYEPVGFVDDNRSKVGQRIHGVPVLGTRADLPRIVAGKDPQEILIAIPRADAATIRLILNALEPHQIRITTLPTLAQVLDGKVTVSQIRELAPEDVLARAAIKLDSTAIRGFIAGKRVMVTGAGGSIGSELCRQIATLKPAALLLFERYENNLFALANDLADRGHDGPITPIIGDVTDAARVAAVLREHHPEIIFHAAAHKHVPLMEQNPCEAIKNNVAGTRVLADAAERFGAERFILISSDKAVNPSSVMGATKRVAELLMQARVRSDTAFLTVRFGNVLASNGSVVPRFLHQIHAGGPVTVTHPEIRRYFMLISEAVHLVLHAAARGSNGATYVLEMGDQVKLVDLARNLIRLSGLRPHRDIGITYIGLRPGEKLSEELVSQDESVAASGVDKILVVGHRTAPVRERLTKDLVQLERLALEGRSAEALEQLRTILPEFQRYAPKPLDSAVEESTALPRLRADRRTATADPRTNDQIVGPIRVPVVGVPL
jgi:FlaA1/EpsC-like NDP-sugar epimerase